MVTNLKFKLGEIVYLKTDIEQLIRVITEISISGNSMSDNVVIYELSQNDESSRHYSIEISRDKDIGINLGI